MLAERERLALVFTLLVPRHDLNLDDALGQPQRRFERVGQATLDVVLHDESVDDDFDRVVLVPRQLHVGAVVQVDLLAVDAGAGEALPHDVVEQSFVFALAATHDRCQHGKARSLRQLQDAVDDLLRALAAHNRTVVRAMRDADPRIQEPEVVVDLGDGADRGARVARRRLLVDRDRRR